MVSKKEALILGLVVVGGLGAASMVAGDSGGSGSGRRAGARAGGILGTPGGAAPIVYQFPAQAAVTFPEPPTFDMSKMVPTVDPKKAELEKYYERQAAGKWMIDPMKVMSIMRGSATIGKPSPATRVQPYLYSGGEIKLGAATPAPWTVKKDVPGASLAPATSLPAAIGIHTALEYARKPKSRGVQGVSAEPKKEVKE